LQARFGGGPTEKARATETSLAAYPTLRGARGLVTVLWAGNGPRLPGAQHKINGGQIFNPWTCPRLCGLLVLRHAGG
jgi:hypothetical protein